MEKYNRNNNANMLKRRSYITKEFKCLPQPPTQCEGKEYFHAAISRENFAKNRYPDVLPYECSRVKLSSSPDYINASFLPGEHAHSYISCQAPLPNTFEDFWKMVQENGVCVIVMLTKFLERRRIKAHCYWPTDLGDTEIFGDVSVTLYSVQNFTADVSVRKFHLSCNGETRTVVHIHYTEWPDCGVPSDTNSMIIVLQLMEKYQNKYAKPVPPTNVRPPLVVHCSAGIGRTGTLLTVHRYITMVKQGQRPTVCDIVKEFRKHRMMMVQTKEQYEFIHRILEDIGVSNIHFTLTNCNPIAVGCKLKRSGWSLPSLNGFSAGGSAPLPLVSSINTTHSSSSPSLNQAGPASPRDHSNFLRQTLDGSGRSTPSGSPREVHHSPKEHTHGHANCVLRQTLDGGSTNTNGRAAPDSGLVHSTNYDYDYEFDLRASLPSFDFDMQSNHIVDCM